MSKFLNKIFGSTPGDGEMQAKEGMSFSICGFGQNIICTIIGSFLTVFMTDAIGFAALPVALLMLFARLFDAFNDPIMGSIVDRTRTQWGKCRPFLKWMAFPIAAMTVICFLPWYPNSSGGFAAISVMYILWGMIYTVADVPYWGLSTAMSNDTYRRGNLLTVARIFCTLGAGVVTIFVPIITGAVTKGDSTIVNSLQLVMNAIAEKNGMLVGTGEEFKSIFVAIPNVEEFISEIGAPDTKEWADAIKALADGGISLSQSGDALWAVKETYSASMMHTLRMTYFIIAIVCVAVSLPLFFVGFAGTVERNVSVDNPPSLKHNLKLLFKNKPLMLIVLSGILGSARMLFTYTGGLYFAKYIMKQESMYTLFTMAIVPGGLISSLLVPYFTKKFGKRNTFIVSHIVGGVAMLLAYIIGIACDRGNYTSVITIVLLFVSLIFAGFPFGFGNILQYAMIGDTVEYLELKTGERAEGICFAMQTLINKIGMAVGAFIGVLAYHIAKIEANNANSITPADKDVIWTMLMLVSAISFFLTVVPLFFYKFTEKEQQEAVAEINRRKALAAGISEEVAFEAVGAEAAVEAEATIESSTNDDTEVTE